MAGKVPAGREPHPDALTSLIQSLPTEIELCAERGLPVVYRVDQEPPAHTRRLMDALGVTVEVHAVTTPRVDAPAAKAVQPVAFAAMDHRASLASVARRADRGDVAATCASCGAETDVATPTHAPACPLYQPDAPADDRETAKGPAWETGRNGRRRSSKERGADGGFTHGEMDRRLEVMLDAQPTDTRCARDGCGWSFSGTAAECRDAFAVHRADAHLAPATKKRVAEKARVVEEPAPVEEPVQPAPAATLPGGRPVRWPREAILDAIRLHAKEHGVPPKSEEWVAKSAGRPTTSTVINRFGKWSAAIEAAGFARPAQGGTSRSSVFASSSVVEKPEAAEPAALPEREPKGRETPVLSGASPAADPGVGSAAAAVVNDSPEQLLGGAELGSRSESADALRALVAAARVFLDTLEKEIP